jgi:hypothetical protein
MAGFRLQASGMGLFYICVNVMATNGSQEQKEMPQVSAQCVRFSGFRASGMGLFYMRVNMKALVMVAHD